MVVQLAVRSAIALYKARTVPAVVEEAEEKVVERKQTFTIDGVPLESLTFDPDDPDQASPYPVEDASIPEVRDSRCTLCLGARRDATATECGHVCKFFISAKLVLLS